MKQIAIKSGEVGQRLDVFVSRWLNLSRAQAQKLIERGQIQVNHGAERASYLIQVDDRVEATTPKQTEREKSRLKLPILYEDDFCIVVDKPAGLATESGRAESVVDFAKTLTTDDDPTRPGIVHRLDRDTSGLLIIAKTGLAKRKLQAEFKKRAVKKTYIALLEGKLSPEKAVIKLPLKRSLAKPTEQAVAAGGKASETSYQVKQYYKGYSLVEAYPKTGRTHQLRVHFSFLGHPIVGDKTYSKTPTNLDRQFLHANAINFKSPSGKLVSLNCPLPSDLTNFLDGLQKV